MSNIAQALRVSGAPKPNNVSGSIQYNVRKPAGFSRGGPTSVPVPPQLAILRKSDSNEISIGIIGDVTIDWGNGTTISYPSGLVKTPRPSGTEIRITGKIQTLDCSNTSISSLDVSGCGSLLVLDCSGTSISSLDVSGCILLRRLFCSNTVISSLDVSGRILLTELDCSGTSISSLDVSGCILFRRLDCSNTNISSLNVSGCTSLVNLDCRSSQILQLMANQVVNQINSGSKANGNSGTLIILGQDPGSLVDTDTMWVNLKAAPNPWIVN